MTNYNKTYNSANPGLIAILVDQSGSMSESYSDGLSKAEHACKAVNDIIQATIESNSSGTKTKDRAAFIIIGYGGNGVNELRSGKLSEFADNPIRTEEVLTKKDDGYGQEINVTESKPIYIEPIASGCTPTGTCLESARQLIEKYHENNPESPATTIINITDGIPYSPDPNLDEKAKSIEEAKKIMSMPHDDGAPLLINIHIGNGQYKCSFPQSEDELQDEPARYLFEISSVIPEARKAEAVKLGLSVKEQSRCMVTNADPEMVVKLLIFGSSGAMNDKMSNN